MKKMLPVLLAALVGLAGCSKKSDPEAATSTTITVTNNAIFGTWEETNWTETVIDPTTGATTVVQSTNYPAGQKTFTYTNAGGYSPRINGAGGDGTFTYTGNKLTHTIGGNSSVCTVEVLTATSLVYSQSGGGGFIERYTLRR